MFQWIPFISYVLVMGITPGPNNIMAMNNSARVGFKKGFVFNLGIFGGIWLVAALCMLFSGFLRAVVPQIELPMKILGASYMVYLIVKIMLPAKKHEVRDSGGSFLMGVLLQFINPKIYIAEITAVSSYILPHFSVLFVLFLFTVLLAFLAFLCNVCWSLFGSVFSIAFNKHGKIVNIVMAVLLLYCAVSLFFGNDHAPNPDLLSPYP